MTAKVVTPQGIARLSPAGGHSPSDALIGKGMPTFESVAVQHAERDRGTDFEPHDVRTLTEYLTALSTSGAQRGRRSIRRQ